MSAPCRMCGEITRKGTPCTRTASYVRVPGNNGLCTTHANAAWLRGESFEEIPLEPPREAK